MKAKSKSFKKDTLKLFLKYKHWQKNTIGVTQLYISFVIVTLFILILNWQEDSEVFFHSKQKFKLPLKQKCFDCCNKYQTKKIKAVSKIKKEMPALSTKPNYFHTSTTAPGALFTTKLKK